jgi:N-acetylglucosaminyldiphosphoundecaprenol N-acetyl-beta-D-mannosaminyltransferase
VHSVVTARDDPLFREAINGADLSVPDGMPLAWALSTKAVPQERIYGPDLMWRVCERAAASRQPVFFYGSSSHVLRRLKERLAASLPALRIAGMIAPPYRAQTDAEDVEATNAINGSGAAIVFVGLGCPKQEMWMAQHRGRIRAVMIGVGAGFDFHAGTLKQAPAWMQNSGLEWLFRLTQEPRRLWRRYLYTNSVFLLSIARAALNRRKSRRPLV